MKIDVEGNLKWMKTLGGSEMESSEAATIDNDGNYLIIGYTQSTDGDVSNSYGLGDLWLVKLDRETLAVTDLNNSSFKIYPNPTQDYISISNDKEISKLSLFDVSGKNILTKSVNSKNEKLNISNFTNGIYILKVEANGKQKSFKIIKK